MNSLKNKLLENITDNKKNIKIEISGIALMKKSNIFPYVIHELIMNVFYMLIGIKLSLFLVNFRLCLLL